ncbi:MAG: major capsid protein E [Gammaproteobacteria bacterium]|nr:MAG: major capsid protein E [Gammaproteobacteria bacterium]
MPLSNQSVFGVRPMTEAINRLPEAPSIIRGLGIFKAEYLATTSVAVESKENTLQLVKPVPRGTPGEPVTDASPDRKTFEMLHLPKNDVVMADDVQNVKAFGTDNKAQAVAEKVNDKLQAMKDDIDFTREYLMLGALKGQILSSDGTTVIEDIYNRFGITRQSFNWALGTANTKVGAKIDATKRALAKKKKGESVNGWAALCSPEFLEELVYHDSLKGIYERYQEGQVYRQGDTEVSFMHKRIKFIAYDEDFGNGVQIPAGEAILLPLGTRKTFREFFAPANMNAAVNTKAKPYYASREKLKHDEGWDLKAQSNPLPLVMRPELVATLTVS